MKKINIKLPPNDESASLEKKIKNHLNDFFKKNTGVAEADVKLSHGAAVISDKVCEIYLKTESKNMFTIQTGASFESSLVKAINKLQTQLNSI